MTALVQTRIDSSVKAGAERVLVDEPNKDTMNAVNRVNKREGLKKISLKEFDNMLDK